ncbi:MAG: hypothetical protein M3132_14745, partial [Actinomycetia bacterium]|nr:hypothetical protein [Actinomycetes bacterium]
MRVTRAFDSPARRKVAMAGLTVLSLAGTGLIWLSAGPVFAALAAIVGGLAVIAAKALMELTGDQKRDLARSQVRLQSMRQEVSDQAVSVEAIGSAVSDQAVSVEAIGSAVSDQAV